MQTVQLCWNLLSQLRNLRWPYPSLNLGRAQAQTVSQSSTIRLAKLLAPHFVKMFSITEGHAIPSTILEAQVVMISKPGKDASLCGNYRPILLLN